MRQSAHDIRRNYSRRLDRIVEAEVERDELKKRWAAVLRLRNDVCYLPKRDFDLDIYRHYRGLMAELEVEIRKLDCDIQRETEILGVMPFPKKQRPRKTVLVDGIRTKIEREYA